PVGSFQAVKHRLASALIATEAAEAAVTWASLDAQRVHKTTAFAVDQSIAVAEAAIQVHGGLGFTWEMGLHFYLKHMLQIRDLLPGLS
ncbi:acyl-CoA dehydrogenase family protein, partial [Pandoraea pneumonica]|uniref:acyl-CoA dehydrogenase family protein n=1 Tax=Pandoraea pneumonica TaxID=2508299 RepID=UPI003CEB4021